MSDEEKEKKSVYLIFSALIDQLAVQRFFGYMAGAIQEGYNDIHLLMQTTGGNVPDGVCLYNFFRSLTAIDLSIYNCGNICSAGVTAYLGGDNRFVSPTGAFMVHRAHATLQGANADVVQARVVSLIMDDRRTEDILKEHVEFTPDQWETHKSLDLWLDANQAITTKIASKIDNFWIPTGRRVVNVFP